jgi:regulator of cell morphogenesis and NO signaling
MSLQEIITVGDFITKDFRTAAVFTKYEIDFCCKEQRTIDEVCTKKNFYEANLLDELNVFMATKNDSGIDFNSWPSDLLIDIPKKNTTVMLRKKLKLLFSL